jgi:hypothetical protein
MGWSALGSLELLGIARGKRRTEIFSGRDEKRRGRVNAVSRQYR